MIRPLPAQTPRPLSAERGDTAINDLSTYAPLLDAVLITQNIVTPGWHSVPVNSESSKAEIAARVIRGDRLGFAICGLFLLFAQHAVVVPVQSCAVPLKYFPVHCRTLIPVAGCFLA
jgi:hypothetical protein